VRDTAVEATRFLQQRNPGAKIAVTDLRDGSIVPHEPQWFSVRDWGDERSPGSEATKPGLLHLRRGCAAGASTTYGGNR
jgi:hypothetical protein